MRPMSWKVGSHENHTIWSGTGPLFEISLSRGREWGRGRREVSGEALIQCVQQLHAYILRSKV